MIGVQKVKARKTIDEKFEVDGLNN